MDETVRGEPFTDYTDYTPIKYCGSEGGYLAEINNEDEQVGDTYFWSSVLHIIILHITHYFYNFSCRKSWEMKVHARRSYSENWLFGGTSSKFICLWPMTSGGSQTSGTASKSARHLDVHHYHHQARSSEVARMRQDMDITIQATQGANVHKPFVISTISVSMCDISLTWTP